jgi:NAD(P)-dependent dehydrogenase (short-subunit alcohol dehydrogenase family)
MHADSACSSWPLLAGRTAVVTGGESGIGRATARRLSRCGARVWVGDLALRAENDVEFSQLGIQRQTCDVRVEADVSRLIAAAAASGRLDILVNNAGVGLVKPITAVTEEEWDRCLDTNLKGAFFGCKHAIAVMQQQGGGAIVNVASNAGLLPRAHDPVYSISKMALVGLTRSLALCHSVDRIRINAVCPGPVSETGMINADLEAAADPEAARQRLIAASPLARAWQRMITPEEVAEAVAYLVSDAAAMVTGTCLAIDGGKSLGVPPVVP